MAMNYNRFCHITLAGKEGTFEILTPKTGRKPDIEVHGILMPSDFARDFEVRIKNLYIKDCNMDLLNSITVSCGYVGKPALVLKGSIDIIYTEEPGPDRVTVIKCLYVDAKMFMNAYCNINLEAGMRLDSILQTLTIQMNKAAELENWDEPEVDMSVAGQISNAPLQWNGPVKDLMPDLKRRFPKAAITIHNNKFKAIDIDNPPERTGRLVPLMYIQSPPNYTAGRVVVTAPWEPGLQPGDRIFLPKTGYGSQDMTLKAGTIRTYYTVMSVQFDFSTVGSNNKMIVTGV